MTESLDQIGPAWLRDVACQVDGLVMGMLQMRHRRRRPGDPPSWIAAADIGSVLQEQLDLWPGAKRETIRRRVRELMHAVMRIHDDVVSSLAGYAIAGCHDDIAEYERYCRKSAVARFVAGRRVTAGQAADDARGQFALFGSTA